MRKNRRKSYEIAIGMKISKKDANIDRFKLILKKSINKSIDIMQTKAEQKLNPSKCKLSNEAKKRLRWMYIIQTEHNDKVAVVARKVGISRQWHQP